MPSLTNEKLLRHARSLATTWALDDAWDLVLKKSPGFGASIALHALAHVLKNWLGGRGFFCCGASKGSTLDGVFVYFLLGRYTGIKLASIVQEPFSSDSFGKPIFSTRSGPPQAFKLTTGSLSTPRVSCVPIARRWGEFHRKSWPLWGGCALLT